MKKLHLSEVPVREVQSPKGRYRKQRREISVALDAREDPNRPHPFEVELVTLPPGASFCPYHSHTAEWEFYLVVSGAGQVRHPGGTEEIRAGDSFVFPPGEAHQLLNPSPEPLTYYVIANNVPSDDCYYPDSDKWAIQSLDKTIRFTEVAYHDGEE